MYYVPVPEAGGERNSPPVSILGREEDVRIHALPPQDHYLCRYNMFRSALLFSHRISAISLAPIQADPDASNNAGRIARSFRLFFDREPFDVRSFEEFDEENW
jgi:hypothetical protein